MSKIVPIRPTSLFKALDRLATDADHVVRRHDELTDLPGVVRKKMDALKNDELIGRLFAEAKRAATLSEYDNATLARCEAAMETLDAAENYEDNDREEGDLRRNVVSVRLAMLIGAFPNGSPSDPEIFARLMIEHALTVENLSLLALDSACRQIVATQKFLPTTSELLKALNQQQENWDRRYSAIYRLADTSRRVLARIEALRRR
jgi:hypothetical protein